MNLNDFNTLANQAIHHIVAVLDTHLKEDTQVDLQEENLIIHFGDDTDYVINKNKVGGQISVSSPQSGSWHFEFEPVKKEWISTQGRKILFEILSQEFSLLAGRKIIISPL
jgi:iron donor protein CyaY